MVNYFDVAISSTVNFLKEGRRRILRAIEKEKEEIDESLKRDLPQKEPPQKSTKEKLAKELVEEVQGKYSFKVEETVYLLEQVVDPTEKSIY